jgi:hypothetical protein
MRKAVASYHFGEGTEFAKLKTTTEKTCALCDGKFTCDDGFRFI